MDESYDFVADDSDNFFDALEELPADDPTESIAFSNIEDELYQSPRSPASSLRFRRRLRHGSSSKEYIDLNLEESFISTSDTLLTDENVATDRDIDGDGVPLIREEEFEKSALTSLKIDGLEDVTSADWPGESRRSPSFLGFLAKMVVKALGLQFNLLSTLLRLPFWSLYYSFALVVNPFGTASQGMGKVMSLWAGAFGSILSVLNKWGEEYKSVLKISLRFGWGFFWCVYVLIVLGGLLVCSFAMSFLTMRLFVEEPVYMKETLYLDYTKDSPVAYVPITYCPDVPCGTSCKEKVDPIQSLHVMHPNHKFQVTVTLELPETEYNRNLGIFQVKVDSLSPNSDVLATSRHPCMFPFRSQAIRVVMTYLKILPLLTGYAAETRTLNLRIKDFNEGSIPTACLMVTIEQRAEYKGGAGIPEIYTASLLLESELPFLKRILWNWRKTVFVWMTMMFFTMGFLFLLICCNPLLLPRSRIGDSQGDLPAGIEMG